MVECPTGDRKVGGSIPSSSQPPLEESVQVRETDVSKCL